MQVFFPHRSVFSHNHMKFSTKDKDADNFRTNCAQVYHGGFWYNGCWSANLNGVYYNTPYYNSTVCFKYCTMVHFDALLIIVLLNFVHIVLHAYQYSPTKYFSERHLSEYILGCQLVKVNYQLVGL